MSTPPLQQVDQDRRIQTVCLLILTAIAAGVALYFLRPVLIPFVLAIFVLYCLTPLVDVQVQYLGVKRAVAVIATILLGCLVIALLWLLILNAVRDIAENADAYQQQFTRLADDVTEHVPLHLLGMESDDSEALLRLTREGAQSIATSLVGSIMGVLSNGVLVLVFMIFLMAGHARTGGKGLLGEIESRIKRYTLTKVFVSALTGITVGVILTLFGIDFAIVFGVLAFLLNFIPNIGSVVATLLPIPVILVDPDLGWFAKTLAIGLPAIVQFTVGNLIEPKVMGESLDLHPVVILLGLIFFGMIWGIVGMLLATPILAIIKIALERIDITRPVGGALAGRMGQEEAGAG
jgi:AI-2 transport protein TqsA